MIKAAALIASAEKCMGWPYASPGTNDSRGIDCSGLFVRIFRDNGGNIYHGSNTIWRKYTTYKGKLTSAAQLKPGMAVFKWNPNTPAKWSDGQGDFQHIGLVASVNPLRIIHASTGTKCVTADSKIGTWKYWAELTGVDYGDTAPAPTPPVGSVTLRKGDKGIAVTELQTMLSERGYDLGRYGIDGDFGSATEKAVRAFQQASGIKADGIVGSATWAALEGRQEPYRGYSVRVSGLTLEEAEKLNDMLAANGRTVTIIKGE